jgi:hypothetical protein
MKAKAEPRSQKPLEIKRGNVIVKVYAGTTCNRRPGVLLSSLQCHLENGPGKQRKPQA